MNRRALQNVSASVHQRLLNIARKTARPFGEVLQYFAMERCLYRLSQSEQADSFVLKGVLLFRIWDTPDSRATRDIDFLADLDNSPPSYSLAKLFKGNGLPSWANQPSAGRRLFRRFWHCLANFCRRYFRLSITTRRSARNGRLLDRGAVPSASL